MKRSRKGRRGRWTAGLVVWGALVLGGCGSSDGLKVRFAADGPPAGASLWLAESTTDGGMVALDLWAARWGGLLGYSVHLVYDDTVLALDETRSFDDARVVGSSTDEEALYVYRLQPGDFAYGGVRRDPADGEVTLEASTRLVSISFRAQRAGMSLVTLEDPVVRRIDGTYVPVAVGNGVVTVKGGK